MLGVNFDKNGILKILEKKTNKKLGRKKSSNVEKIKENTEDPNP